MKELLKKSFEKIKLPFLYVAIGFILCLLSVYAYKKYTEKPQGKIDEYEFVDKDGVYHKQYYNNSIDYIKNLDKALYDSIKKYSDNINFVLQFDYRKDYHTGKIEEKPDSIYIEKDSSTFTYTSKDNDTLQYKLQINSQTQPNWYSLDIRTHEKFTIVNKNFDNDLNQMTINPNGNGAIENVIVVNKKKQQNIFNKLFIGPSISYGYNFQDKHLSPVIGISIGYNILGTK